MVISLSSDKAVWNAVMNNDVVREIREAVTEGLYSLVYTCWSVYDLHFIQRNVLANIDHYVLLSCFFENCIVIILFLGLSTTGKSISEGSEDSVNDTNPVTQLLRWMFVNTKDKVIEVVEKITKIVNELVQHMNKGKTDTNGVDSFQEKLKSSFFLSIMVLLIVVVSRSRKC